MLGLTTVVLLGCVVVTVKDDAVVSVLLDRFFYTTSRYSTDTAVPNRPRPTHNPSPKSSATSHPGFQAHGCYNRPVMSLQSQFSDNQSTRPERPASSPYWEEPASSPYWDESEIADFDSDPPAADPQRSASPAILQGLNEPQQQAVLTTDGPLLIVAGPGSGKTRVITHRIAYLVEECGVAPWRILAVTFTNKAAREMRERLDRLMMGSGEAVTMGTFHAVCARILRRHGERVGLGRNFTIYDQDDQIDAVKSAMELAEIDPRSYNPRALLSRISAAKSSLYDSRQMAQSAYDADDEYGAHWVDVCARVYRYYEEALTRQNALDFDDLLMRTAQLLETSPEVKAQYHDRYRYLLIDEFQDTNVAQYRLSRLLTGPHQNLCVVGDPDQSIYSWRNADIRNILSFQSDFPNATVISLGENYRSTKNILNAADSVIRSNRERIERELFTNNAVGSQLTLHEAYSEEDEAAWAVDEVSRLSRSNQYRSGDCAIMYRINAQSRAFEDQCMRQGIPYRLVGGVRFLPPQGNQGHHVLPAGDLQPRRRGQPTAHHQHARPGHRRQNCPGPDHLRRPQRHDHSRRHDRYRQRAHCGSSLPHRRHRPRRPVHCQPLSDPRPPRRRRARAGRRRSPRPCPRHVGPRKHIQAQDDGDERWENILELRGLAEDYGPPGDGSIDGLSAFLERVSLVSDVDQYEQSEDALTLITLHQAKGLEFPVVMMAGMEEGLLPHSRSMDTLKEIEEERRLCYVGMTRAKERLYLLRAFRRRYPSSGGVSLPSRFLEDIPDEVMASPAVDRPGGTRAGAYSLGASGDRPGRNEDAVIGGDYATRRRETRTRLGEGDGASGQSTRGRLRGNIDEKLTEWESSRSVRTQQPRRAPLTVGEIVRHRVFGDGVVQDVQGEGETEQASIEFGGEVGIKRLLVSLAPLERD